MCNGASSTAQSHALPLTWHIYVDCLIKRRVEQCCLPPPHQYEIARANTAPQPSRFIVITGLALQRSRGIARMLCQSETSLAKPTSRTDTRKHRTAYHTEDSVQYATDSPLNGSICGSIRKIRQADTLKRTVLRKHPQTMPEQHLHAVHLTETSERRTTTGSYNGLPYRCFRKISQIGAL